MQILANKQHNIPRDEWVRRFKARIVQQLEVSGDVDSIGNAELESWPELDERLVEYLSADWERELPEAAADENLTIAYLSGGFRAEVAAYAQLVLRPR